MRKLISEMLIASVIFVTPAATFAQVNDSTIINSGDHLDFDSSASQTTNVTSTTIQNFSATQIVNADANTGNNLVADNIVLNGTVSLDTGNALNVVDLSASGNNAATAINVAGSGASNTTSLVNTGDYADVDTKAKSTTTIDATTVQSMNVFQSCGDSQYGYGELGGYRGYRDGCNANTGYNEVVDNIGNVNVKTGNAGNDLRFGATGNNSATAINAGGSPFGPLSGLGTTNVSNITNTGDHLDFDSKASSRTYVNATTVQDLWATQLFDLDANSGYNLLAGNIGGANYNGGDAGNMVRATVSGNNASTWIGGMWDSLMPLGTNLTSLVNTGDYADVDTRVRTRTNVYSTTLQYFLGYQNASLESDTGWNGFFDNIGPGGGLSSGNAGNLLTPVHAGGNNALTTIGAGLFDWLGWMGGWWWV